MPGEGSDTVHPAVAHSPALSADQIDRVAADPDLQRLRTTELELGEGRVGIEFCQAVAGVVVARHEVSIWDVDTVYRNVLRVE